MADNWDDILAEPIASLSDPTVAAPVDAERGIEEQRGGWLAVQALRDISPRSQDAPVTMPDAAEMLQLKLTPQAETPEATPKLPPSLADQLSLTWAARRRHAAVESEPEVAPAPAPRLTPRRVEAPAPAEPPSPVSVWRKPLEAVARVFNRQPQPEPEAASAPIEAPASPAARVEPRTVLAIAEPSIEDPAPAPRAALPDVPLTLAAPQRHLDTPEPDATPASRGIDAPQPATPRDVPLAETPVVRATRLEAPATPDAPARRAIETNATAADASQGEPPEASHATPSLAPRRGLLAWLLPRRAAEPPTAPTTPVAPPAVRPATPAPAPGRVEPSATTDAPPAGREPTLAEALPTLRTSASEPDAPYEPELTHEALQDIPPQVALTHLLRNTPEETSDADAETLRQTLSRMVEAAPVTEPARIETAGDQGETLPAVLQARMEGLLDVPLHEVRIFRGQVSQRLTERMQADAVTIGNQVHVAPGEGEPGLASGRALLAHEVTHYAVHRIEAEGPAATISGPSASGEPAWPVFSGIAPEPGAPSLDAEETLALRMEHVMSRPDAFDAPSPAQPGLPAPNASPLSLQHRAPPPQIIMAPGGGIPGALFGGASGGFGADAGGFGPFAGFNADSMSGGMSSNGAWCRHGAVGPHAQRRPGRLLQRLRHGRSGPGIRSGSRGRRRGLRGQRRDD